MLLDLVALAILLVFVVVGALRGALAAGTSLACLVVGYTGGWLAARHGSGLFADVDALPGMLATAAAGTVGFLCGYVACAGVGFALRRWESRWRGDLPRSAADRLTGGLLGALRGSVIVLLLSILATWLDAARDLGLWPELAGLPQTESSQVTRISSGVVEGLVETALGEGGGAASKVVAHLAAQPGASLKSLQVLASDERIERLQGDRLFWSLVENGASERAINQGSFHAIVYDPDMRSQLAELGLVSEEAAADPQIFRDAMAEMLSALGPRIQGLRNDPEILRLSQDPQIVAMIESGDTFGLVVHPDVQRIVARVSAQP